MPYSPVTQPLPVPLRNDGTPSSTVAVTITRVCPASISTLPSALGMKSGVIFTVRKSSGARPSVRKTVSLFPRPLLSVSQFADRHEMLSTNAAC
jgi:hypothetical protein